jgi:hypothetical protein
MRIHSIFEEINDLLYVIAYRRNKSVLTILQDKWSDALWLHNFFEENKDDLHSGEWGSISVDKAVEQTLDDAQLLLYKLRHASHKDIKEMFETLHDEKFGVTDFQELKAKGFFIEKSWLRIYAILQNSKYYITGGAIKLTRAMQDRPHTLKELTTIKWVKRKLRIEDIESLIVYIDK